MTSDRERRDVARRLREIEQGVIGALIPTGELAENILRAIDYGHSGAMTPYGRLADLIEPPARCPHYMYPCCRTDAGGDYIDRDALLALAVNLDARATELLKVNDLDQSRQRRSARLAHATDLMAACSRIREVLGVDR